MRSGPADRGQFRGEVRERVERQAAVPAGARQGDRGDGLRVGQVLQPRLELRREFDADHVGARGVQQGGDHRGEGGAVVAYPDQVGLPGLGEGVHRGPRVGVRQRRLPRRSQRRRHIAEPSSARRRTGPSQ